MVTYCTTPYAGIAGKPLEEVMEALKKTSIGQWIASHPILTILAVIIAVAFLMVIPASTSISAALPYLLLLLCPIAHLFLHGGHQGHPGHEMREKQEDHH